MALGLHLGWLIIQQHQNIISTRFLICYDSQEWKQGAERLSNYPRLAKQSLSDSSPLLLVHDIGSHMLVFRFLSCKGVLKTNKQKANIHVEKKAKDINRQLGQMCNKYIKKHGNSLLVGTVRKKNKNNNHRCSWWKRKQVQMFWRLIKQSGSDTLKYVFPWIYFPGIPRNLFQGSNHKCA